MKDLATPLQRIKALRDKNPDTHYKFKQWMVIKGVSLSKKRTDEVLLRYINLWNSFSKPEDKL